MPSSKVVCHGIASKAFVSELRPFLLAKIFALTSQILRAMVPCQPAAKSKIFFVKNGTTPGNAVALFLMQVTKQFIAVEFATHQTTLR